MRRFYSKFSEINNKILLSMAYVVFENNHKLPFYESISLKCSNNLQNYIKVNHLADGNVCVTPSDFLSDAHSIPLQRPSFCPFAILKQNNEVNLPETKLKWIAVAVVLLLENREGLLLLTKRASHLRTFPNVWVAPGGHVDENETLAAAALRELSEECGIFLTMDDVDMNILCAWESTFPTTLDFGMPKYHHLVIYFKAVIKTKEFNKEKLIVNVDEVSSFCWLDKAKVFAIVQSFPDPIDLNSIEIDPTDENEQFKCIEVAMVDNNLEYNTIIKPMSVLTATVSKISDLHLLPERVSTGTKYGMYYWLKQTTIQ